MKRLSVSVAAVCATLAVASPADAERPAVVTNPDWLRRPTAEDMAHFYPMLASTLGIVGRATISCSVAADGSLTDCKAVSEQPTDFGFGTAAVAMSTAFRMRPMTVNGKAVDGGTVRIPLRFMLPQDGKASAPPEPASEADLREGRRLIDALGAVDITLAGFAAMNDKISSGETPEAVRKVAVEALAKAAQDHREELREAYARAVASVFSETDAAAIADFVAVANLPENKALQSVYLKINDDFWRRTRLRARDVFCAAHPCEALPEAKSASRTGWVQDPRWALSPDAARIANARPAVAGLLGLSGSARLTCGLDKAGMLQDCKVAQEGPVGLGYGEAALTLANAYRLDPAQLGSGSGGRRVSVQIAFPAQSMPEAYRAAKPKSERALALARELASANEARDLARRDVELRLMNYQAKTPRGADPKTYDAAIEALRIAADETIPDFMEQNASAMAANLGEAQISTILAFAGSSAFRAQQERGGAMNVAMGKAAHYVFDRILADARAVVCKGRDCLPAALQPTAAGPDASATNP